MKTDKWDEYARNPKSHRFANGWLGGIVVLTIILIIVLSVAMN